MPTTIAKLRSAETSYLKDGKIDATEAKALVDAAKSGSADAKAAVREMFARDAFDTGVDRKKMLASLGGDAPKASPIAGQKVGNTTVVRTFGPPEGYSNKFQAIATARMQGAEPLAVVKDANGKWHAAQTKDALTSTDIKSAFPLKSVDMKAYNDALKMPEGNDDEKGAKAKALAVASLGVPPELVTTGIGWTNFDKEKINVNVQDTNANGKTHIHNSSCPCGKNGAAVELTLGRLKDRPEFAAATLAHEAQHKSDDDALNGKLDGKLSTGIEKTAVKGLTGAGSGSREISAYGRAFLTTVDKDKEVALDQLLGFMQSEKDVQNSTLHGDMNKEMKALYATLPEDQKAQFKEVVAAAELRYPDSSLWKDLFGKEAKPKVSANDIPVGTKPGE